MAALLQAQGKLSEYLKVRSLRDSPYSTETRIHDTGYGPTSPTNYSNRTRLSRTLTVSNQPKETLLSEFVHKGLSVLTTLPDIHGCPQTYDVELEEALMTLSWLEVKRL